MAKELSISGFAATLMAVPATAASAAIIIPPSNALSMSLKYFSGSSLEIFNAPEGATLGSPRTTNGVTLGSGYLLGATEVVNTTGAPKFFLAATGATGVAYVLFGLSAGY